MWISRDFSSPSASGLLPIKVLKGPRQVGKTSLLENMAIGQVIYFDDSATRHIASENPRAFLDQYPPNLVLDEAARAPELFVEIKRRVDAERRENKRSVNYWITGSNQTLLRKNVSESLAGRANFFDLNTLSLHELGPLNLADQTMRGGWPELRANTALDPTRYLNDLITTFIEKDIVAAAGIEKSFAFSKMLSLNAGRIGQLYVAQEMAQLCSVDLTTIQSWNNLLVHNGLIALIPPFHSNFNKRLIKSPKLFFLDAALAVRLQGWTEFQPLFTSPAMGNIFENIVYTELQRTFINRGMIPKIFHLRSKEKVEIDFFVELPNQKFVALEAKLTPSEYSKHKLKLLDSLKLNIAEVYTVCPGQRIKMASCKSIIPEELWETFQNLM
jgi:uncharacterized protein